MRLAPSRAGLQVFVLAGPLASRIAATLLAHQSAGAGAPGARQLLLEAASNSPQAPDLIASSQQPGGGRQAEALPLNATPLHQEAQQQLGAALEAGEWQQQHRKQLATSAANYEPEARESLAATLARLGGWELLLVVALISLILISIVGNCLVCVAICTDRRLRKLGNAFIVSLAIADLFVSCLVMTFALCNDLMDWWMFGERFCDIWISFDIMCCTASILNLCAISLDRFIHIKDCLLYNQLMTRRVALSAVLGIWLISALVSFVPINLGWHKPDHFKSRAPNAASLMNGSHVGAGAADEAHAILLAAGARPGEPPDDDLTRAKRIRRQTTPFGPAPASTASENGGTRAAARPQPPWPQHFGHNTQFAQLAQAARFQSGAERRSANKDFVPTKRSPAGNRRQSARRPSSGSSGGCGGGGGAAQVDLGGSSRAAANYYDSNQLAGERAPRPASATKQWDDQVEFNPPDGPPGRREQIKPQPRKKRQAAQSASRRPPAQTDRSSGRPTALLDHADERPAELGGAPHPREPAQGSALERALGRGHLPQCTMTLTPTYAIISSTISFYIPCLIMLGLYSRLFACARRHVRNIRAITRAPHPIAAASGLTLQAASSAPTQTSPRDTSSSCRSRSSQMHEPAAASTSLSAAPSRRGPLASRARTWIKFAARGPPSGGSGAHCLAPQRPGQQESAHARSTAPLRAGRNQPTSGAGSRPLRAANDRGAAPHPMARASSTTNGANEKTIDQTPAAREDEPFLARRQTGADERHRPATPSTANDHCDNANDSSLTQRASIESKFVSSATGVKLNLTPSEFQQPQPQAEQQQQAAIAASQLQQQLHKQQQTSQLATHKAAITLGIIMGTFLFCWVPFFCLNIIKAFYVDSIPGSMFRAFTWLGYANSALNPIIYGIHNSEFRHAFNRIFFKHLTLKNGRHYLNRRFSYDLRPHHQQARQQPARQQAQHRDRHQHQPLQAATNHNTSSTLSGAPAAPGPNHKAGSPARKLSDRADKRPSLRLEEVRTLVDHERGPRTGPHQGQIQLQQPAQDPSAPEQKGLAIFHRSSEKT